MASTNSKVVVKLKALILIHMLKAKRVLIIIVIVALYYFHNLNK